MSNKEKSNPELGEEYTATILTLLYEAWPSRIGLDAQTVTGIEFNLERIYSHSEYPSREWDICADLFKWLEREAYIITDGLQGNIWTLGKTELSAKAMEVLKKVPDPLNPDKKRSLIDAIVDASKESGIQARNQLIKMAMTSLYQALK